MPTWRCPHCGTPQAESSRCWVCRRSTTSCETCRHFRRGVAGGLGLCGLDPRHTALQGTEMRACWAAPEPAQELASPRATSVGLSARDAVPAPRRTFVPVDELQRAGDTGAPTAAPVAATTPGTPGADRAGWSLWGDAEI